MNTGSLPIRRLQIHTYVEQPRTAYESLRVRVIVYILVFFITTFCAVTSDLVFGVPTKTAATGSIILTIVLLLFSPLVYQIIQRALAHRQLQALIVGRGTLDLDAKPVLIYGAGDGGELMIREILNNPDHRYVPVGFIDDDGRKAGKKIHGYRIFDSNDLPNLIQAYGISDVLISSFKVPEARLDSLRRMGVCLKKMSIRIE